MTESHGRFEQAPDESRNGTAVAVAFLALFIFGVGVACSDWLLRRHSRGGAIPQITYLPAPTRLTPEVGMLFQWTFDDSRSPSPLESAERTALESYGWVDEAHHRIRIPVSRAIELYLQNQRAPGESPRRGAEEH